MYTVIYRTQDIAIATKMKTVILYTAGCIWKTGEENEIEI